MSLLVFGLAAGTMVARADSTDATCDVRKDGDKQKGKSGPCTFSQRQGYISIDLKNGDTISLNPAGSANHYRDQHGKRSGHSSSREYGINPLDDGAFEVVSSNPFCVVRFNRHGEPQHYSDECTSEQRRESNEYAQRNH
jgi:hypothetical protein